MSLPTDSGITIGRRQRTYTLAVLVLVFTSSHIDREIVAILGQPIKESLAISDTQLGLLTGVMFALFYATLGMPMAMWADRNNRRNLIAFSIALWSAMTALCGMAQNYLQLRLARIGVGVGEAGSNPPSHSIIADLYGPAERATALAIFGTGVNLGVMLGYLIGGWVNEWLDWRWAFIVAGLPGLAIALIVRFTVVEPPRGYSDGRTAEVEAPPFWTVARTMFRSTVIRNTVIAGTLVSFTGYALARNGNRRNRHGAGSPGRGRRRRWNFCRRLVRGPVVEAQPGLAGLGHGGDQRGDVTAGGGSVHQRERRRHHMVLHPACGFRRRLHRPGVRNHPVGDSSGDAIRRGSHQSVHPQHHRPRPGAILRWRDQRPVRRQ
jgi:hypothetical protein